MAKKLIARKGTGRSSEVYAVDALPESSQGGVDWEDVTPAGDGGGSAFAHLTEDTEYSELRADWMVRLGTAAGLRVGDAFPPPDGPGATVETDVFPGRVELYGPAASLSDVVLSVWDIENANAPYLEAHRDGSIHWGDGTAAPDVSLARDDGTGFWGSGLVASDALFVAGDGLSLGIADGTQTQSAELRPNTVKLVGTGGTRQLTVDADGDLAITGVGKITTH